MEKKLYFLFLPNEHKESVSNFFIKLYSAENNFPNLFITNEQTLNPPLLSFHSPLANPTQNPPPLAFSPSHSANPTQYASFSPALYLSLRKPYPVRSTHSLSPYLPLSSLSLSVSVSLPLIGADDNFMPKMAISTHQGAVDRNQEEKKTLLRGLDALKANIEAVCCRFKGRPSSLVVLSANQHRLGATL